MPEFTSPMRKLDLVALDQLARLLHAGADVVGRILDQQFDRPAENAALGVDLLDGELGAHHLVLRHRRIDAGQRIDHADSSGVSPRALMMKGDATCRAPAAAAPLSMVRRLIMQMRLEPASTALQAAA